MRRKINRQSELDFKPSNLKVTNEYFEQYEAMSILLDTNPEILNLVHKDIKEGLESVNSQAPDGHCKYTSDTVLRILMCMIMEGLSLRRIVVRIDDSHILRRFVRIFEGHMMDYSSLCKLKNQISPQTWKKMNQVLARHAVEQDPIEGEQLRLDTTAVETNIHHPTDSGLLWDVYRVFSRLIEHARELDPDVAGDRRLLKKKAKKLHTKISRLASKKSPTSMEKLRSPYEQLIQLVTGIQEWGTEVGRNLEARKGRYSELNQAIAECIIEELAHYGHLGLRVIDQAARRVLDGEQVPNDEKLFSIFEPHTELLKRGKAAKAIEYGHMIQIQQVESKFITDYDVFENKPVEHELLKPALDGHKKLFGDYPEVLSADKGYYEGMAAIKQLEQNIDVVAIAKKGKRTEEEQERESDPDFGSGQRFRAGVEGTISYLKHVFRLFRCQNKGWEHYTRTVGAAIFTHNLLILTRT